MRQGTPARISIMVNILMFAIHTMLYQVPFWGKMRFCELYTSQKSPFWILSTILSSFEPKWIYIFLLLTLKNVFLNNYIIVIYFFESVKSKNFPILVLSLSKQINFWYIIFDIIFKHIFSENAKIRNFMKKIFFWSKWLFRLKNSL